MIGKTISHYKILEQIGGGGMGVVYKAEDLKLKRTVALKFLPPELTRDSQARKRFLQEAQSASALEHTNICTIHEIEETGDGQIFIVMSFCKGKSLRTLIEHGPLDLVKTLDIALQICNGLATAHKENVIHRDIKPDNIIITDKGTAKIIDFGLAKLVNQSRYTKEGAVLGTIAYTSPEQATSSDVDQRSDIWSLSVLLYEMLTAQLPFKGDYDQAVIYSILKEEYLPISSIRNDIPNVMEQIINKALSKDPDKRYQDIDELAVDLRKFANSLEKQQTFKRLEQAAKEDSRKLAAIMFTDMVGYSALTQRNENLALELLEEHRQILRALFPKYDGMEVETAGDAFFVEFSSALEAVNCAIEIQKQLFNHNKSVSTEKEIKIRIGVHIGDVVHRGYNVLGDGVNIAARIEPCAQSGGICISQDVARQVENKIDFTLKRIETEKLKNIKLPIEIYAVDLPWLQGESLIKTKFDVKKSYRALLPIILIVILILLAVFIWPFKMPLSAEQNSIAVLPFENLSAKIENEYFSDGMTEDIIAHLSKIGGLKVISRTSIMQYKNTQKNLKDIGYELNVAKILEGSVRRVGNRVRIVAQLIDAEADEHLWTETYDEHLTQIFDIQTAVAQKIAKSLKAKISEKEREQLERKTTDNLEAYDLYLKGRYYWNKRMPKDLKKGIDYFERALQKDDRYALAYSGLADSYAILGNYCILPPEEAYDKVKESALKALQIDDQLAEAHTSMALAHLHYDWAWDKAEVEFERAIELNPKYAIAHSVYAQYLTALKRFDEAKIYRKRAKDLDPLSIAARLDEAFELFIAEDDDRTIEHCQQLIQENPHLGLAYIPIAGSYIEKSMYQDAIELLSRASMLCGGHHAIVAANGYAYALSGRADDALSMIEILLERSKEEYISSFWIAVVYTGLEDKNNAFIWLEKSYEQRDGSLVFIDVLPIFKNLRSDPRYTKLISNIGLVRD